MSAPAIVCSALSFAWPDGDRVLSGLDVAFGAGRTGLIGANGSGKSTLLRLIAGELRPTAGTVRVAGPVGYLAQTVALHADRCSVADLLGVAAQRQALRAVEAGDPSAIADVGDAWDIEERAVAALARFGLPADLDRRADTLSGGEAVLTGLAGLLVRRLPVTLLDEPTNNLDRGSPRAARPTTARRRRRAARVRRGPGCWSARRAASPAGAARAGPPAR